MSFSHNSDSQRGYVLKLNDGTSALNNTGIVGSLYDGPVLFKHTPRCTLFREKHRIRLCKVPPKDLGCMFEQGHVSQVAFEDWGKCRPWAGVVITAPRLSGTRPDQLDNGAVVDVTAGYQYAGEVEHRRFVVGDGMPIFLAAGNYDTFRAQVVSIAAGGAPVRIAWTDGAANVAFQGNLQSPAIVSGVAIAERVVPAGAIKVISTAAVTISQRDYSPGGGVVDLMTDAVAAGEAIDIVGQTIQTSGATTLKFFLAPI